MGIERTPTEHFGTKAAALEATGVETTAGSLNAMKIWLDAERDIERKASQRKGVIEKREAIFLDLITEGAREPSAAKALAACEAAPLCHTIRGRSMLRSGEFAAAAPAPPIIAT